MATCEILLILFDKLKRYRVIVLSKYFQLEHAAQVDINEMHIGLLLYTYLLGSSSCKKNRCIVDINKVIKGEILFKDRSPKYYIHVGHNIFPILNIK